MKKIHIYLVMSALFVQCNFTPNEVSTKQNTTKQKSAKSITKSIPSEPISIYEIDKIEGLPLKPIHLENSDSNCKFAFSTQCFSIVGIDNIKGKSYYVTKSEDEEDPLISYYDENAKFIKSHKYGTLSYSTVHNGNSLLYKGSSFIVYNFEENKIIDSIVSIRGYSFEEILKKEDTAGMPHYQIEEIELIKQKFPAIKHLKVISEDDYEKRYPDKNYSDYLEKEYLAFLKKEINKDVYSLDNEIIFPKKNISIYLESMPFKLPEYATENKDSEPKLSTKIFLEEKDIEKAFTLTKINKHGGKLTKDIYHYNLIHNTDTIQLKNEERLFLQNVSENEDFFVLVLQIGDTYSFFRYNKK